MRVGNKRRAMLAVACIGASGALVQANGVYTWLNICEDKFTCSGGGGGENPPPRVCWCQVAWDDEGAWSACWGGGSFCANPSPSYPSVATDDVTIEMSTIDSRCDGGPDNGELCTQDSNCRGLCVGGPKGGLPCLGANSCPDPQTCMAHLCEEEQYLVIELITVTIGKLTIKTESTPGADQLDLRFHSDDDPAPEPPAVGHTLSTEDLTVDGTNGAVTLKVTDEAEVETD